MNPYGNDMTVDQVIGSAYQVVRYVAANMETLIELSDSIDPIKSVLGGLQSIIDNMPAFQVIANNLDTLIDNVALLNGSREALRRSYAEAGYNLVDGSFEAGGTLVNANDALLQESTGKGFTGPTGTVAAGTNPSSGGFVDRSNELFNEDLVSSLATRTNLNTSLLDSDGVVEAMTISANRGFLPTKYSSQWEEPLSGAAYPQALAESENYYFITEDDGTGSPYNSKIYRINKSTGVKSAGSPYIASHGQGIGVISDDVVFIGGSTDSKIATYSFVTGLVTETTCTGLYKDFPFCYDKDSDRIYQLQDVNATSGFIVRLSILDRVNGFIGDTSIPLMIVKGGYPQGLTYSGGQLYITCGGSWALSTGGAWNDYWTLYKMSTGGVLLDYMAFRRSTMGIPLGLSSLTQHEPQGISIRDGKISLLQLFDGGSGVVKSIYKEDQAGLLVRSVPRNKFHLYNGLNDIGINIATLSAGSSIKTIVAGMSDGTSLTFSFANEAWVSNDIGFQFGVCTVTRVNGFRAYAIAVESSSDITANTTPRAAIISVFGTIQSKPKLIVGESNTLSAGYAGPGSPAVAGPITITNASLVNNMMFHVSDTVSGSSFVSKFSRAEINGYIASGASITLKSNLSGAIVMTFTVSGVNISSVSGTPYLRYVFTN